jgi:uncharacterized protein with PIN domain
MKHTIYDKKGYINMNCNCERNLVKTENRIKGLMDIEHPVYICENCKRYYVKGNFQWYEVAHDCNGNWSNVGYPIVNSIPITE